MVATLNNLTNLVNTVIFIESLTFKAVLFDYISQNQISK